MVWQQNEVPSVVGESLENVATQRWEIAQGIRPRDEHADAYHCPWHVS